LVINHNQLKQWATIRKFRTVESRAVIRKYRIPERPQKLHQIGQHQVVRKTRTTKAEGRKVENIDFSISKPAKTPKKTEQLICTYFLTSAKRAIIAEKKNTHGGLNIQKQSKKSRKFIIPPFSPIIPQR